MTHEGYLAKRTSEQIRTERTSIRETYLKIILIQAFLFVSCVIMSPGYVTTTFKNETALPWVLGVFGAEGILMWLHETIAPTSKINRISCYLCTFLLGIVPAILVPVLAPAIITVTNSLCTGYPAW
ncbi:MAG TPA: hypothetical protein PKZ32_08550 [Candidatus Melainabacteria bacterium]|nr:hypothetical protein [Candidatus Melainabacteria bacterium]